MNKEFLLGAMLGMAVGAVVALNSSCVKSLVLKGQKEVEKQVKSCLQKAKKQEENSQPSSQE